MVRERILSKRGKRFALSLKPFSKKQLRKHNAEANSIGLEPLAAPPTGKTHFSSVSRRVKRLLGISRPIVFIDDIVSYSKVVGKDFFKKIRPSVEERYADKKLSSRQIDRLAYKALRSLVGPGEALIDKATLKCYVYVERYATSSLVSLMYPIKTERDATDFKNSIVAHEVGQVLYSVRKVEQGKEPSPEVGEFVGRFFEFDYLLKKNPKLAAKLLKNYRKEGQAGFIFSPSEDHNVASRLMAEFFERVKDSRKRRRLVREVARRDFKGIGEVRAFIFG